jgi:hypothetical protein
MTAKTVTAAIIPGLAKGSFSSISELGFAEIPLVFYG